MRDIPRICGRIDDGDGDRNMTAEEGLIRENFDAGNILWADWFDFRDAIKRFFCYKTYGMPKAT